MRTSLVRPLLLFCLFEVFAASPPLGAQPPSEDWNVAVLDQILAPVLPGQVLARVGDMHILVTNLQAWRDQLAGGPAKLSAFSGDVPTWTDGDVYYSFATSGTNAVPENYQKAFLDAANEWATFADLHFIPRTTQSNYVTVQLAGGLEGGESAVGMVGGQQFLSVGLGSWNRGTLCHEIGHTLGLVHEHQRSDRNSYVNILTNNIVPGGIGNFVLLPDSRNQGAYDFLSVMHYARNYLSVNPATLDTIVTLPAYTNYIDLMGEPGPVVLSDGDRAGMAAVYGAGPAISAQVTNTQDSGPGSLRAALYYAYDHHGTHITFNIPTNDPGCSNGVFTIQPTDQLPWLVNSTFLDGASQPTNSQSNTNGPTIQINGALAPRPDTYASGLVLGGTNCRAQSLVINGFAACGILITNAASNIVAGCYVAVDPSGMIAVSNGLPAVTISSAPNSATTGNTIGGASTAARNVISGSAFQGMIILGAGTTGNFVEGNYIGVNAAGASALPNSWEGIEIAGGARGNYIGGTSPAQRNIISGNSIQGVSLQDPGTISNLVEGNWIGLDATGKSAVPNAGSGVEIFDGAQSNIIGGTVPGAGNIISGNAADGIMMDESGTSGNFVEGNWIGLDATGASALANSYSGVELLTGAQGNVIGCVGGRNFISGNTLNGVLIDDGAFANIVQGNTIGLNIDNASAVPNGQAGVGMFGNATSNVVGGTTPGAANLIADNLNGGIALYYADTTNNVLRGNSIFGNTGGGIGLYEDANQSGSESAPALVSAVAASNTTISGMLTSSANTAFQLDFYTSPPPANQAQAATYLGAATIVTGAGGSASFTNKVGTSVPLGQIITATATDPAGNTSALSAGITVTGTNPTNTPKPLIGSVSASGQAINVNFVSVQGLVYRVEYTDNLATTNWSILADQIIGTGSQIQLIDPGVAKLPERFYRLGVLP